MVWATKVPAKGAIDFVTNFVIAAISETGYRTIILKSDGEPAILALKQDVKLKAKDIEIILKEARTGDHSANGSVEVAVRDPKGIQGTSASTPQ